jgi:hypothetical protein
METTAAISTIQHVAMPPRRLMDSFGFIIGISFFIILANVKEHAPLSARARVDHGVKVETTEDHVNRAADRGCCVSSCSTLRFWYNAIHTA